MTRRRLRGGTAPPTAAKDPQHQHDRQTEMRPVEPGPAAFPHKRARRSRPPHRKTRRCSGPLVNIPKPKKHPRAASTFAKEGFPSRSTSRTRRITYCQAPNQVRNSDDRYRLRYNASISASRPFSMRPMFVSKKMAPDQCPARYPASAPSVQTTVQRPKRQARRAPLGNAGGPFVVRVRLTMANDSAAASQLMSGGLLR